MGICTKDTMYISTAARKIMHDRIGIKENCELEDDLHREEK